MIVELFGLPGSGKTTLAKSFAEEGAVLISSSGWPRMLAESFLFIVFHPVRAIKLFYFIYTHAPEEYRILLITNLFFAANAKYMRARRASRGGAVAVVDQGHFQALLSLFGSSPSDAVLHELVRVLPKPELLLVVDASKTEREKRITTRGRAVRRTAGEEIFSRSIPLFTAEHVSHLVVPGAAETKLTPLLTRHISYVTHARMPTEKAHGVSIAHMCTAFAGAGRDVSLVVPQRKNPIKKDLFSFYGVPRSFSVRELPSKDFLGAGFTNPFFFFLSRLWFFFAVNTHSIPPGVVYTREPELAWKFSKTHIAVFEAHHWPRGFAGRFQGWLLRNIELVVCNSRGTEAAAKWEDVAHTLVAPNGFDQTLFDTAERKTRSELGLPEGTLALYIGSGRPGKGLEVVEKAAGLVDHTAALVRVIGADKTRVEPAHVPEYLLSADILLLPNTRAGESETYTSPIKLFEYLAAGKAIIASDLPSIREILADGDAFFVPPGDANALAGAVEALAKDTKLRARLAARAKALSVSYTWDARAERILGAITA